MTDTITENGVPRAIKCANFPRWTEYNEMLPTLIELPEFYTCRAGFTSRRRFALAAEAALYPEIQAEYDRFVFYPRTVPNDQTYTGKVLLQLYSIGRIRSTSYDGALYKSIIEALCEFDTADYKTFIHPEEARLAFALGQIWAPRTVVSVGAYFGFWSMLAAIGAIRAGTLQSALFLDTNTAVCAIAERMAQALNVERYIGISDVNILSTGQSAPQGQLYLLDAETPRDFHDEQLRDKAICGPLAAKIWDVAPADAHLLVHNVLFDDPLGLNSLKPRLKYNKNNMSAFRALTSQMPWQYEINSCEGIGLYKM